MVKEREMEIESERRERGWERGREMMSEGEREDEQDKRERVRDLG